MISDAGQLHYLKDVLRLKPGDALAAADENGAEYRGRIAAIEKARALLTVSKVKSARRTGLKLTVACALPKGTRMDDIIDQLTQLGVERIIPVQTERVVVKLDEARKEARLKRWRKIAASAARQSQRSAVPAVEPVSPIEKVIEQSNDYDLKIIFTTAGKRTPIREVTFRSKKGGIIMLVGPEGDFTPGEVKLALRHGFMPVSLGKTVLRVATAALAAAAYIRLSAGE